MTKIDRRKFLQKSKQTTLGFASGMTILANAGSVRGTPAADKVVLAAVGVGGRGTHLATHPEWGFLARGDCEYAYVCDPDSKKAAASAPVFAKMQHGKSPQVVNDFRKVLDDKAVDAIISATPDHWHALSTVWACQADKDVYVEKPAHHSCWEGQKMVEAARKYNRVVQVGTQTRSAAYALSAKQYIEQGKLGTIHLCRIFNQKPPWGMTKKTPDSNPPAGFDWNIWNGPAPQHRYNSGWRRTWNHMWRYSGGDIANDASHQIDLARWLLGVTYPKTVYSTGGRYATNPEELVAETPDTQIALYDFDGLVVSFELTLYGNYMLKTDPVVRQSDMFPYWLQNSTRVELYGTKGLMLAGRHGGGWQVFDRTKGRKPVVKAQAYGRFPDREHKQNFIECLRTRQRPNADVLEGHRSALWTHYANISYRLGAQKIAIDPQTERIIDNPDALALFKRSYRKPWIVPDEV
jgi:predicted dehydrogenase